MLPLFLMISVYPAFFLSSKLIRDCRDNRRMVLSTRKMIAGRGSSSTTGAPVQRAASRGANRDRPWRRDEKEHQYRNQIATSRGLDRGELRCGLQKLASTMSREYCAATQGGVSRDVSQQVELCLLSLVWGWKGKQN